MLALVNVTGTSDAAGAARAAVAVSVALDDASRAARNDDERRAVAELRSRAQPALVAAFGVPGSDKAAAPSAAALVGNRSFLEAPASAHHDAAGYLNLHASDAWAVLRPRLLAMTWPDVARLVWRDEKRFTLDLVARLQTSSPRLQRPLFEALTYPEDPYAQIAPLLPEDGSLWVPEVGSMLAAVLQRALNASVARLETRYVVATDGAVATMHATGVGGTVGAAELLPTTPLDLVVAPLLRRGIVDVKPTAGPITAARGPRAVAITWETEPSRWNWCRATPADATAEEVAAALRARYGGTDSELFAAGLADAAPLWGLPEEWAFRIRPESARPRIGTPRALRDDPPARRVAQLAGTRASLEVAAAQSKPGPLAPNSAGSVAELLADCATQLGDIARELTRWALAEHVAEARDLTLMKARELAAGTDSERAKWATIAEAQRARLFRVSGAVREVNAAAARVGLKDFRSPSAQPLRAVAEKYAAAAAASHLAQTSERLITEAATQQAMVSQQVLSATLIDLETARRDGDLMGAGESLMGLERVRSDNALDNGRGVENQLARGGNVVGKDVTLAQLEAGEAALHTRIRGVWLQLLNMGLEAERAGIGMTAWVASLASSRFRDLAGLTEAIRGELTAVEDQWSASLKGQGLRSDAAIQARQSALDTARRRYSAIGQDRDLAHFFQEGASVIQSQRLRTAVVQAAALLGINVLSLGAASFVSESLAATWTTEAGVATVAELSTTARVALRVASFATEATTSSLGQAIVTGERPDRALLANSLVMFAMNRVLGTIGAELGAAKQMRAEIDREAEALGAVERQLETPWRSVGKIAAWTAKESLVISGKTIMGMTFGYVSGRVTEALRPRSSGETSGTPSDSQLNEWAIQGASIALGRYVHAAIGERMPSYRRLAERSGANRAKALLAEAERTQALAASLAEHAQPLVALDVLDARVRILNEELAALDEAEQSGGGPSPTERSWMRADLHAQLANVRTDATLAVRFQLAGMAELVPDALWRGTPQDADRAVASLRAAGHDVRESFDAKSGRRTVTVNGRDLVIEERGARNSSQNPAATPALGESALLASQALDGTGEARAHASHATPEQTPGADVASEDPREHASPEPAPTSSRALLGDLTAALLRRRIPAAARQVLETRWNVIGQRAQRLAATMHSADPTTVAAVRDQIDKIRTSASNTLAGDESSSPRSATAQANWRNANALVERWVAAKTPLTLDRIKELNATIEKGLPHNQGTPGEWRHGDRAATKLNTAKESVPDEDKIYIAHELVPEQMADFVDWYNENSATLSPIELAAKSYQKLVSIHPFSDGNGRTTRLVMDWVLQSNGLPPAAIGADDKNVAVYGTDGLRAMQAGSPLTEAGVTPAEATEKVTDAVERSLDMLEAATQGVHR
ncbi:MAG TPA: Fic family protein [Kofleriaceae bacterium]